MSLISADHQQRGYILERLLAELFELFDLDPRASFRVTGEQIDGAFTFDSTNYLFEGNGKLNPSGLPTSVRWPENSIESSTMRWGCH